MRTQISIKYIPHKQKTSTANFIQARIAIDALHMLLCIQKQKLNMPLGLSPAPATPPPPFPLQVPTSSKAEFVTNSGGKEGGGRGSEGVDG